MIYHLQDGLLHFQAPALGYKNVVGCKEHRQALGGEQSIQVTEFTYTIGFQPNKKTTSLFRYLARSVPKAKSLLPVLNAFQIGLSSICVIGGVALFRLDIRFACRVTKKDKRLR
jgi:hypothetical protein